MSSFKLKLFVVGTKKIEFRRSVLFYALSWVLLLNSRSRHNLKPPAVKKVVTHTWELSMVSSGFLEVFRWPWLIPKVPRHGETYMSGTVGTRWSILSRDNSWNWISIKWCFLCQNLRKSKMCSFYYRAHLQLTTFPILILGNWNGKSMANYNPWNRMKLRQPSLYSRIKQPVGMESHVSMVLRKSKQFQISER